MSELIKLLFLADVNSIHTQRWANALCAEGYSVMIFSLGQPTNKTKDYLYPDIETKGIRVSKDISKKSDGNFSKLIYLKVLPNLKKILKEFQPDILHAHYASSYGLIGMLSGYSPFVVSLWGSDIYSFPKRTRIHSYLIKRIFRRADLICSTSENMLIEAKKYTDKAIIITPFGIDLEQFPLKEKKSDRITIGTIKTLSHIYGIDLLIESFALIQKKHKEKNIHLLIVGDGVEKENYIRLAEEKLENNSYTFTGYIDHENILEYYHQLDVYVALSRSESFGVAILEAGACGIPVVVSDAKGFLEIVEDGKTGFIIPKGEPTKVCEVIEKLILDSRYNQEIGMNARKNIEKNFLWSSSVIKMIEGYNSLTYQKNQPKTFS